MNGLGMTKSAAQLLYGQYLFWMHSKYLDRSATRSFPSSVQICFCSSSAEERLC